MDDLKRPGSRILRTSGPALCPSRLLHDADSKFPVEQIQITNFQEQKKGLGRQFLKIFFTQNLYPQFPGLGGFGANPSSWIQETCRVSGLGSSDKKQAQVDRCHRR